MNFQKPHLCQSIPYWTWNCLITYTNNIRAKITRLWKLQHQCKLHIVILDYYWLKNNMKFSKTMTSHKMMTKILSGQEKNGFKKDLPTLLSCKFSHVYTIKKQSYGFSCLLCTCDFFKRLKLNSPKGLMQFQLFENLTWVYYTELETVWLPILIILRSVYKKLTSPIDVCLAQSEATGNHAKKM